jgi:hypothetical protein
MMEDERPTEPKQQSVFRTVTGLDSTTGPHQPCNPEGEISTRSVHSTIRHLYRTALLHCLPSITSWKPSGDFSDITHCSSYGVCLQSNPQPMIQHLDRLDVIHGYLPVIQERFRPTCRPLLNDSKPHGTAIDWWCRTGAPAQSASQTRQRSLR